MRGLPLLIASAAIAADGPPPTWAERLRLEAHGFVSFGWLRTWGNDWLGDTADGTSDFHEAAVNGVARPMDRLRLGAQVFTRRIGRYEDRPALDWAYADWRGADWFGLRAGRVKIPFGLANDLMDVDAARTPVFLPGAVYALRARDSFISVDGALAYGHLDAGAAGTLAWATYGGDKPLHGDSSTTQYYSELGLGDPVTAAGTDWTAGGMLAWETPCPGLELRASALYQDDLRIDGRAGTGRITTTAPYYLLLLGSASWTQGPLTLAAEYLRVRGDSTVVIAPPGAALRIDDRMESGYLSATWRLCPWLDLYAAAEAAQMRVDGANPHSYRGVAACAIRPLRNWTLKAEFQQIDGTMSLAERDNPEGFDHVWQLLALKTTVDF